MRFLTALGVRVPRVAAERAACVPLLCALLVPLTCAPRAPSCRDVRSAFQLLHPGFRWAPDALSSGADLQVCLHKGATCCSRKMEERYQLAARQNLESGLQASTSQLKLLIIQNAAVFQEAFEMVLRHGRNATLRMLMEEFPAMKSGATAAVGQLFLDFSLYILGSDTRVEEMVSSFFSRLFPLVYRRLLDGGSSASEECLRRVWREVGAFGSHPKLLGARLSQSLLATRIFLQALNLGIEVVNTTDHLRPSRDCARSLLRLWYCPLCQGLLGARPCPTHCLAVMQGCLGGASEVQPYWMGYVNGVAALAATMRGEQDLEAVVMWLDTLVRMAVRHALANRNHLSTTVSGMCSHSPQRKSRATALTDLPPRAADPPSLHPLPFHPEETLASRSRQFVTSLKAFSTFFSGLGEILCSRELFMTNDSFCWNGQEMTDRYSPGAKQLHTHLPEPKHKAPEPVINQIIDKLKHINQLLRMVTLPGKRKRARPAGGTVEQGGLVHRDEEGLESGDCDDEDECGVFSGLGPPPRHKRLRIFADFADNLAMDDLSFHGYILTPSDRGDGVSVKGGARDPISFSKVLSRSTLFLSFYMILLGLQ